MVSTQKITNDTGFTCGSTTGSIGVWLRPTNWSSGDNYTHPIWNMCGNSGNNNDSPSFQKYSDNSIYAGFYFSGVEQRIILSDSGLFSVGVWAHWVFSWTTASSGSCSLYKNGTLVKSNATLSSPHFTTGYTLGAYSSTVGNGASANTDLAEFTYWSGYQLTANEMIALAKGARTTRIASSYIGLYVPLFGLQNTEPDLSGNGYAGTFTDSPAYATHAPISPFTPKSVTPGYVAAAATYRIARPTIFLPPVHPCLFE